MVDDSSTGTLEKVSDQSIYVIDDCSLNTSFGEGSHPNYQLLYIGRENSKRNLSIRQRGCSGLWTDVYVQVPRRDYVVFSLFLAPPRQH